MFGQMEKQKMMNKITKYASLVCLPNLFMQILTSVLENKLFVITNATSSKQHPSNLFHLEMKVCVKNSWPWSFFYVRIVISKHDVPTTDIYGHHVLETIKRFFFAAYSLISQLCEVSEKKVRKIRNS